MWLYAALLAAFFVPDYTAEGMKALEEQRYQAAIDIFTKAAEADPKDYSAHFHIGLAQSLLNRDADAIASYKKVLELKPGLYEAQLNLGIVLLNAKQAAEAASSLEEAAKQRPKQFRPVYHLAEAHLAAGAPEKAIPHFQSAVEIDATSQAAQIGLARALARTGKLEEAAPLFEKTGNLLELADWYEKANKREEAIAIYRKFPDEPGVRERLGGLLLESGDSAKAIPELEASVAKSPTAANRYALALAYIGGNEYAKAEPVLQAALADEPQNLNLRLQFARVLRQQKKYAPAAQEFFRVAQTQPDKAEHWSELAGVLVLAEQYPQALAALDKVKALNAEKPGHFYLRAIVLDKHKMYEPALENYEKFLAGSENKYPDEEFKARQRVRIIKQERSKR
ncbi:MAG TPA: tetratricopeptide repeat protein [Bryobacteraceae bacterium]|nr:tetratricopeptide repeat protein [Bryobacteraceae bacterium]